MQLKWWGVLLSGSLILQSSPAMEHVAQAGASVQTIGAASAGALAQAANAPAASRVLCVQPGGVATGAPCSTPVAFATIQAGVDAASPGDEVRVATGTYESGSGAAVVTIMQAIALRGGYAGGLSGWTSSLGPTDTLIDGQGARAGIAVGSGASVTLANLAVNAGGITNAGSVLVDSGELALESGGTTSGFLTVGSGARLRFPDGNQTLTSGSSVDGAGITIVDGGTLTIGSSIADQVSIANLELDNGQLNGPGGVSVSGTLTWNGGTMGGGGTTTLTNGATLSVLSEPTSAHRLDGRTLTNHGTFNWSGQGTLTLADGATLQNTGTWSISPAGGLTLADGGGTASNIQNSGTLNLGNGVGAVTIGGSFANLAGANISDPAGSGQVGSGIPLHFTANNGLTNAGAITFASALAGMTVAGTYTQTGGTTTLAGGTLTATTVSLQGGTLNGVGTVAANVTNGATVSPGNPTGALSISGRYTQTAGGTLAIGIGGTGSSQLGELSVGGPTSLDGALALSILNGFGPLPGEGFPVANLPGGRSGTFSSVSGTSAGGANTFGVQYNAFDFTVTVSGPGPTVTSTRTATPTAIPSDRPITFNVNTTADPPVGLTVCATNVPNECSIRRALNEAVLSGTTGQITINIPPGTYILTPNFASLTIGPSSAPFHLAIQGAGAGQTIIDGNNATNIFFINGSPLPVNTHVVSIDGVTLQHGTGQGAAILNQNTTINLSNSVVTDNNNAASVLDNNGGGPAVLAISNTTITHNLSRGSAVVTNYFPNLNGAPILTIDHSTISNNTVITSFGGGAIFNGSTATITDSIITGNTLPCFAGGGGINNGGSGASLTLTNSTVTSNTAVGGGGILNGAPEGNVLSGQMTVINSVVNGNTAVATSVGAPPFCAPGQSGGAFAGAGGGIFNSAGMQLTLINSTVSDNTAAGATFTGNVTKAGGAGIFSIGQITVTGSTVSGNVLQSQAGGGIFLFGYYQGFLPSTITNSTISGNTAPMGGAISVGGCCGVTAGVTLTADTVAFNSTGLRVDTGGAASLRNTIVARTATGANCSGSIVDQGFNLDDGSSCSFAAANRDIVGHDPLLAALALNAPGATQTHGLQTGSPAIDVGTCTDATGATLDTDQRGVTRPQGAGCDIGAYEVAGAPTPTPTVTSTPPLPGLVWTIGGTMPTPRYALGAATAHDRRIYVIGGFNQPAGGDVNRVEVYDPATQTWADAADMPTPRFGMGVVTGTDGRVYAIGGAHNPSLDYLPTVEVLDPAANSWSGLPPLPTPRTLSCAAALPDGRIFAIGGFGQTGILDTVEVFSPAANAWTTAPSLLTPRFGLTCVVAPDGRIYAIAGTDGTGKPTGVVEAFNPATNTWSSVAGLPTPRFGAAASVGGDQRIYVAGGDDGAGHDLNVVESFNVTTGAWSPAASMPTPRELLATVLGSDGRVYSFGGVNGSQLVSLNDVQIFGPPAFTPIPTPTPTATQTPTIAQTLTPTLTATQTPTMTPSPTASATPTVTPTPTFTLTSTPTATPTLTPTPTLSPTPTPTLAPTSSPTATPTLSPHPAPVVSFTSPADGNQLTAQTAIVASVSSANLDHWVLSSRSQGDTSSVQLATGTTPETNATLATFDPTMLLNGLYELDLTATDTFGQSSTVSINVAVARNLKIGVFTLSFTDLTIPVSGFPLQITRTYDSRDKSSHDFGVGWTLSTTNIRVQQSGRLGDGWTGTISSDFIPNFCVSATSSHLVTLTLPDGTVEQFEPALGPPCAQLQPPQLVTLAYAPVPGTNTQATLEPLDVADAFVFGNFPGPVVLNDTTTGVPVNPHRFRLTMQNGTAMVLDQQRGGLQSITDLNGNSLSFTAGGMTHSSGKGAPFTRDPQGRIHQIADPLGNTITYDYDANGDLVRVTDQVGNVTHFTYDNAHNLQTVVDPRGITGARSTYDTQGRLTSITDASGNVIQLTHDIAGRQEVVHDRLGNPTVYTYDDQGNVLSQRDPLGNTTSYTYDPNGNRLTQTDPLGHVTTLAYDSRNNLLSETDPLGNTTTHTYDGFGNELTDTDPLGRVTTNIYDGNENLTSIKDPMGNVTSFTYTTGGLKASMTDPSGGVTRSSYDAVGNLAQETDPLGHVTAYTYDPNGNSLTETKTRTAAGTTQRLTTTHQYDALNRLVKTTYPDNSATQASYNSIGKQATATDQLGRQTSFAYDNLGRLATTTNPDGTTETSTYDAEGRLLTSTDRAGRVTTHAYDFDGRLTRTTYADGATDGTSYDAAGQTTSTTDPRGNVTSYSYDAAGRRMSITDALNHSTTFVYDVAGNQTGLTDPRGNTTTYQYDSDNRRTRVTFADGTTQVTAFDALGRRTAETDQAGFTTHYGRDALGRLTSVTDPLGQITSYSYDEVGNQTTQTDANNRLTSFTYDQLGRRTGRTLPLGMTEIIAYDAVGNLTSKTDFNRKTATYSYDALNRLLSRTPDPSLGQPAVVFTYTSTGQRASMQDASGTTTYTYDLRDRRLTKATPFGTLTYTYDLAGNLASIRSSNANGASVDYAYDSVDRLSALTDHALNPGTTTYTYDANGNLAGDVYPNGVHTTYTYDRLSRLSGMSMANGASAPLASYAYTLGPAGNRTQVAELGGRTVSYTYDSLYRLTAETIAADPHGLNGSIGYTYDPAGNQLSRTSTLASVPSAIHAYDANDRLTTDSYDANGNTIGSNGNTYVYDFEDHLTGMNNGAVALVYDGDGNRVAETVGGVTTTYLVDDRNPTGHAQVLEERSGGVVQRVYAYGLSRVSQEQVPGAATTPSFYQYDGLSDVRHLTDTSGAITDANDYTAFGIATGSSGTTPNVNRFKGEPFDQSLGLTYLRARYLSSSDGRFWTIDPGKGSEFRPLSHHNYIYVEDDPVNLLDPSGRGPSNIIWGQRIHQIIGADFKGQRGDCGLVDERIAFILAVRSFMHGGDPGASVPWYFGWWRRPDLTDVCDQEVWEIKPLGSSYIGEEQLAEYLEILDTVDFGWTPGTSYQYPTPRFLFETPFGDVSVRLYYPGPGMIVYDATTALGEPVPLRVPYAESEFAGLLAIAALAAGLAALL